MPGKSKKKNKPKIYWDKVTRIFSNVHKQVDPIYFRRVIVGTVDISRHLVKVKGKNHILNQ